MKFLKEKWEWLLGIVLLLIGVIASSKTKSRVKEKDLEAKIDNKEKTRVAQIKITEDYHNKEIEILSKSNEKASRIEKEKKDRIKELSEDHSKLDDYLKKAGLTKK